MIILQTLPSLPSLAPPIQEGSGNQTRVWTLSLRKLGHVYIWRSVIWVIAGVNYIISYQQHLLWCQKICKLAICDDA